MQYDFNWKTLSAMAGVTEWNSYFRLFPGAIRSPQVVLFFTHLLRHIPGKLRIVWDGLAAHRRGRRGISFDSSAGGSGSSSFPAAPRN